MTRALVPLANGVEEMEAVIIIDVLRRAGWEVVSAAVTGQPVTASRRVKLLADAEWHAVDPAGFDVLVIPGGAGGSCTLASDEGILETLRCFVESSRLVGAICAGPLVLQAAGVLDEHRCTCHPAVREELTAGTVVDERVVVSENVVTSQGPGTAMEFSLALIRMVDGPPAADRVAEGLILPPLR